MTTTAETGAHKVYGTDFSALWRKGHKPERGAGYRALPCRAASFAKSLAALLLLGAGLVMPALDRELGLLLLLLGPVAERVAPPRILELELGQLQAFPDVDGAFHELALGQ